MKKTKLKSGTAYMIRNKTCGNPWTMTMFYTKESAWNYFSEVCKNHKWEFPIENYVVELVTFGIK